MQPARNVIQLLEDRLATRAISSEPLDEKIIADLGQAARLTPSCFNKQPWRFVFLTGDGARSRGVEALSAGNRVWASRAPLLIIGYSKASDDCQLPDGRDYHQFDLGMAVMNLMLAATEHGLVARPMAGFNPTRARELFDLAEEDQPLVMLAVGHPAEDESHLPDHYRGLSQKPRERKPLQDILRTL